MFAHTQLNAVQRWQVENFDILPDSTFISTRAAAAILGIGRSTLWKMAEAGTFPPGVKLGPTHTVWPKGVIVAWQRAMMAQTDAPPPTGIARVAQLQRLEREAA
jgi:predicted DNA-binding transcriptional regulator AlpA